MIRRILLILNSCSDSAMLIEKACEVAASAEAELIGLFLENPPHSGGLALPTARAFCADGRLDIECPVLPQSVREKLDQIEQAVRRNSALFLECSRKAGIRSRFLSEKGDPLQLMLDKGRSADLILLRNPREEEDEVKTKSLLAVESLSIESGRPVLLIPPEDRFPGPTMVAYDGSAPASRSLSAAAEYSAVCRTADFNILIIADDSNKYKILKSATQDYLRPFGFRVSCRQASGKLEEQIVNYAKETCAGLIALPPYSSSRIKAALFGSPTKEISKSLSAQILLTA